MNLRGDKMCRQVDGCLFLTGFTHDDKMSENTSHPKKKKKWSMPAPVRLKPDFETVALGENFHPQQIESPTTGIEIKRLARGILQGVGGGEKLFKDQPLVFFGYAYAEILNDEFRPILAIAD